jgi:hypothetical protein
MLEVYKNKRINRKKDTLIKKAYKLKELNSINIALIVDILYTNLRTIYCSHYL